MVAYIPSILLLYWISWLLRRLHWLELSIRHVCSLNLILDLLQLVKAVAYEHLALIEVVGLGLVDGKAGLVLGIGNVIIGFIDAATIRWAASVVEVVLMDCVTCFLST